MKLHACRSQCVCVLFVDLLSMAILLWHLVISCRICSIRPLSSQSLRCLRKMLSLHFWEIFGNAVCLLALLSPISLDTNELLKGAGALHSPEHSQIESRPDSRPSQHCQMWRKDERCLWITYVWPCLANTRTHGPTHVLHCLTRYTDLHALAPTLNAFVLSVS